MTHVISHALSSLQSATTAITMIPRRLSILLGSALGTNAMGLISFVVAARALSDSSFVDLGRLQALTTIAAAAGTLRFDTAILSETARNDLDSLTALSAIAATATSAIAAIAFFISGEDALFCAVAAAVALSTSLFQVETTATLRAGRETRVATLRILRSFFQGAAIIVGSLLRTEAVLIFAFVAASALLLSRRSIVTAIRAFSQASTTRRNLHQVAMSYRHFPLVSGPAAVLQSIAVELPSLVAPSIFSAENAADLIRVDRVIRSPMVMVWSALRDFYTAQFYNVSVESRLRLAYRHMARLGILSAVALVGCIPLLAAIFPTLLGISTSVSSYAGGLCCAVGLSMITTSPVAALSLVYRLQAITLRVVAVGLFLRLFVVGTTYFTGAHPLMFLAGIALSAVTADLLFARLVYNRIAHTTIQPPHEPLHAAP